MIRVNEIYVSQNEAIRILDTEENRDILEAQFQSGNKRLRVIVYDDCSLKFAKFTGSQSIRVINKNYQLYHRTNYNKIWNRLNEVQE